MSANSCYASRTATFSITPPSPTGDTLKQCIGSDSELASCGNIDQVISMRVLEFMKHFSQNRDWLRAG
jgi:hypothetical protein